MLTTVLGLQTLTTLETMITADVLLSGALCGFGAPDLIRRSPPPSWPDAEKAVSVRSAFCRQEAIVINSRIIISENTLI
mgnify:CR=1 FL=1